LSYINWIIVTIIIIIVENAVDARNSDELNSTPEDGQIQRRNILYTVGKSVRVVFDRDRNSMQTTPVAFSSHTTFARHVSTERL